ncbi:hypothetical protein [Variovorax paradoxus]|uniref:hypothetical protein n=1 Tax=Variovorax paradoxus TaxID=34073 RepID=UPI0003FD91BC|nr:hypothetical protein [Variovorax paradoxus]
MRYVPSPAFALPKSLASIRMVILAIRSDATAAGTKSKGGRRIELGEGANGAALGRK